MLSALREFIEDWKTARRTRKARSEGASRNRDYTVVLRWAEPYDHYNNTPEILHVRAATPWGALMSAQLQAARDNAHRVDEFTGDIEAPELLAAAAAHLKRVAIFKGKQRPQDVGTQF
ncbi:hypothetical protein [Streptomyces chartreusis]|uniref:Uncharacterized protein n=1 Tax=Streptomyces chartreusis TaxID=1969 RepID=A0A7H8TA64_STRCX|nr:hypothetical protein [Streptomyces chartreusis]QKZ20385.1 hypothetical protein HUT05_25360 [Streptomyces chartreusis]